MNRINDGVGFDGRGLDLMTPEVSSSPMFPRYCVSAGVLESGPHLGFSGA